MSLDTGEWEDLLFDEEPEYDGRPVGSLELATQAMFTYSDDLTALEAGWLSDWSLLAEGSYRTALLHLPTDTVYKVPRELGAVGDANPAERAYWRMMTAHWDKGWDEFVPPHRLFTVVEGGLMPLTVMALPYMGNITRSGDHPVELVEAAAHVGCFDTCSRNVRFSRGSWYLIDASGNEWAEDPTLFGPSPGDGCSDCNPEYRLHGKRTVNLDY